MIGLLVDDHPIYRKGLSVVLATIGRSITILEANDGEEALELFGAHAAIELCVIDLKLPKLDGISLISRIHQLRPEVPIVVNSQTDSIDEISRAVDAGAIGFVPKSAAVDVLISTVGEALKGNMILDAEVASKLRNLRAQRNNIEAGASLRQLEILGLCCEGLSNREIAKRLNLSEATIKSGLTKLMQLTGTHDRTSCAVEAILCGWITPTLRNP